MVEAYVKLTTVTNFSAITFASLSDIAVTTV